MIFLPFLPCTSITFSSFHQPLCSILPAVEQYIFNPLPEFRINIIIDSQLPGVYNPHIHSRLYGMIKETGMHRLPDCVVPPEGKRKIAHTSAHMHTRQRLFDSLGGFEISFSILIVLRDAGRYGEYVRVENDVLRRKPHFLGENAVSATTDLHLPLVTIRLSFLIESHNYNGRSVSPDKFRLPNKLFLTLLQRDRIDDPLPLQVFEPCFNDRPLGRVHHYRHLSDIRLSCNKP